MYTHKNFKTKKAFREAVKARVAFLAEQGGGSNVYSPRPITVFQPNGDLTGAEPPLNGVVTVEGPHYPEPHRWYVRATLKNGEVVKVS